jgi:response regulator of citrate/malate metabolism
VITVLVVDDDFRVARIHSAFVDRVEGFRTVGVAHTPGPMRLTRRAR